VTLGKLENAATALAPREGLAPGEDEEPAAPAVVRVGDEAVDDREVELLPVVAGVRVAALAPEVAGLARADREEVGRAAPVARAKPLLRGGVAPVDEHVGEDGLDERAQGRPAEAALGERALGHLQEREAESRLVLLDRGRVAQPRRRSSGPRPQASFHPVREGAAKR
jgi:hypothetical protein